MYININYSSGLFYVCDPLMCVADVAQGVEWGIYQSKGQWLRLRLLQSSCRNIPGHDTEPQIAPNASIGI